MKDRVINYSSCAINLVLPQFPSPSYLWLIPLYQAKISPDTCTRKKITLSQIFCHRRDGINKVSWSPKGCIYTSKSHMLYWDSLQETPFCHWGRIKRQRYLFSEESWLTGGIESYTWKISDAIPFYAWLFPGNRDRV